MFNYKRLSVAILTIYAAFMFYKPATIADSIIIAALVAFICYENYIESRRPKKTPKELSELQLEFDREELKLRILDIQREYQRRSISKLPGARSDEKKVIF